MSEGNTQKRRMKPAHSAALLAGLGSVVLGIAVWMFGNELGLAKGYIMFFQPMLIGYALGRAHEAARQHKLAA
jgi:hypothetical protein